MGEVANGISDTTQEQVSDVPESKQSDLVSYESHRKLLGEKKRVESEARELKERLALYEQEKLELEGKKDEALTSWKKKAETYETELKQTKQKYAWNTVENQIKSHALEHGCTNTEVLMRLLDKDVLKGLEVDDNFQVDRKGITDLLEASKKQYADLNLFGKRKVEIHDVQGKAQLPSETPLRELSRAEQNKKIDELLMGAISNMK